MNQSSVEKKLQEHFSHKSFLEKTRIFVLYHVEKIFLLVLIFVAIILFFFIRSAISGFYKMPSLKATKVTEKYSFSPQNIRSFAISKKPVSAAEFLDFVHKSGYIPNIRKTGKAIFHNSKENKLEFLPISKELRLSAVAPVTFVNYLDAVNFCNWKSKQDGLTPVYKILKDDFVKINPSAEGYRLPTAEEWEYAAIKNKSILEFGVSEWTSSVYESDVDSFNCICRIIKGHNVFEKSSGKLAGYFSYSDELYPVDTIGFRIVKSGD